MKINAMYQNTRTSMMHLALMTILCAILLAPLSALAAGPALIAIGSPLPSFTLPALDGRSVTPSEEGKGRPVVVHFWNSGCMSCLKEMPALESLYQQYKDQGLVIYAVNIRDPHKVATAFADRMKITLPILLDAVGKAAIQYQVMGLPRTFFIDRKGMLKHKLLGEASADILNKCIQNIL